MNQKIVIQKLKTLLKREKDLEAEAVIQRVQDEKVSGHETYVSDAKEELRKAMDGRTTVLVDTGGSLYEIELEVDDSAGYSTRTVVRDAK